MDHLFLYPANSLIFDTNRFSINKIILQLQFSCNLKLPFIDL